MIKICFSIMRKDKETLIFASLSFIMLVILGIFFFGALFLMNTPIGLIHLPLYIFVLCLTIFSIQFFNAAVIACANMRIKGMSPTFHDGLSTAKRYYKRIFKWSLVKVGFGLLFGINMSILKTPLTHYARNIANQIWNLITYLVVPVMIIEDRDVSDAVKRSFQLFKKSWAENIIGQVSMGLIFIGLAMLWFIPVGLIIIYSVTNTLSSAQLQFYFTFVLLGIFYWIALLIMSSAINAIYSALLYNYAVNGSVKGYKLNK